MLNSEPPFSPSDRLARLNKLLGYKQQVKALGERVSSALAKANDRSEPPAAAEAAQALLAADTAVTALLNTADLPALERGDLKELKPQIDNGLREYVGVLFADVAMARAAAAVFTKDYFGTLPAGSLIRFGVFFREQPDFRPAPKIQARSKAKIPVRPGTKPKQTSGNTEIDPLEAPRVSWGLVRTATEGQADEKLVELHKNAVARLKQLEPPPKPKRLRWIFIVAGIAVTGLLIYWFFWPQIHSLYPASSPAGAPDLILTVKGRNFGKDPVVSAVFWDGQRRDSSLISSDEITTTIRAIDLQKPALATVRIFGGKLLNLIPLWSRRQTFVIGEEAPTPTATPTVPTATPSSTPTPTNTPLPTATAIVGVLNCDPGFESPAQATAERSPIISDDKLLPGQSEVITATWTLKPLPGACTSSLLQGHDFKLQPKRGKEPQGVAFSVADRGRVDDGKLVVIATFTIDLDLLRKGTTQRPSFEMLVRTGNGEQDWLRVPLLELVLDLKLTPVTATPTPTLTPTPLPTSTPIPPSAAATASAPAGASRPPLTGLVCQKGEWDAELSVTISWKEITLGKDECYDVRIWRGTQAPKGVEGGCVETPTKTFKPKTSDNVTESGKYNVEVYVIRKLEPSGLEDLTKPTTCEVDIKVKETGGTKTDRPIH